MANGKHLVTEPSWCKGCGYCVTFCPKEVLALKKEKVIIKNPSACTCCGICEMHCPDFAIWVEKEAE